MEAEGQTVIVKVPDRRKGALSKLAAIHTEQAALQLLDQIGSHAAASLLATDPKVGLLVLEDLGDGPSLATILLETDPDSASRAARATATALGTMHAQTIGHEDAYHEIRERLSPHDREAGRFTLRGIDIRSCINDLPPLLAGNDLLDLSGLDSELQGIIDELAEPGDFLALSSGDPCPDNERITDSGVRFFDFDAAAFRHALVDAAHYVIPFPNCWCWRRLPNNLAKDMLAAHRRQLTAASAQACDDDRYDEALARTSAAWVLWTLLRRLPHTACDAARSVTMRTRIVAALTSFSELAVNSNQLPKLADYCHLLLRALCTRWPDSAIETYPAFGGPSWSLTR